MAGLVIADPKLLALVAFLVGDPKNLLGPEERKALRATIEKLNRNEALTPEELALIDKLAALYGKRKLLLSWEVYAKSPQGIRVRKEEAAAACRHAATEARSAKSLCAAKDEKSLRQDLRALGECRDVDDELFASIVESLAGCVCSDQYQKSAFMRERKASVLCSGWE